jgi:hypothetical protein
VVIDIKREEGVAVGIVAGWQQVGVTENITNTSTAAKMVGC